MIKLLALDIAATTGYAYNDGHGSIILDKKARDGYRLLLFERALKDLIKTISPGAVVFESAYSNPKRPTAAKILYEYGGIAQKVCAELGIPTHSYSPSEIKTHATEHGNAPKEAMLQSAEMCFPGKVFATHDEADAVWLLNYASSKIDTYPTEYTRSIFSHEKLKYKKS